MDAQAAARERLLDRFHLALGWLFDVGFVAIFMAFPYWTSPDCPAGTAKVLNLTFFPEHVWVQIVRPEGHHS